MVVPAVGILYVVAFRVTLGGGGEMAGSCLHFPRSLRDMAGEGRALDSLRSARDISDGAAAVSVHDEVRAKCRLWMVFVVLHTLNTCSELLNATSGLTKPTHRNKGPPLKTYATIVESGAA